MIFCEIKNGFAADFESEMYYSSVAGPFSNMPLPNNVVLTTPSSDNTTDIGTPTMRYRNAYVTGVFTTNLTATTITAQNVTATSNVTTPAITLNGSDLGTELATFVSGNGTIGDIPQWSGTSTLSNSTLVAANLVSGPSSATNGNLAVFSGSTGKSIADGGNLATYLSSYLVNPPTADDTVDLGSASKRMRTLYAVDVKTTTIEAATPTFTNVLYNGAILEGSSATSTDATGISLGVAANSGVNSVCIGNNAAAPGTTAVALGSTAAASQTGAIAIGSNAVANQSNAIQIGSGTNNVANTVQLGSTTTTNIKPLSSACDLATSAKPFVNVWAQNNRTLGVPSSVSLYSMFADNGVSSTNVETNISTSASSIGSLVLPSGLPNGMNFTFSLSEQFTSSLGDTLTIRLYTGGSTVLGAISIPVALGTAGVAGFLEIFCTVRASSLSVLMKESFGSVRSYNLASFSTSGTNTLSLTAQWGGSASQYFVHQIALSSSFYNGA